MALRATVPKMSAQKLLVTQRMREREGRVLWDEVTGSGPGNFPIQPPAPMKGVLGWKTWFYERGLESAATDVEKGVFAMKVHSALQEEFAKIETHVPAVASHHREGGRVLHRFQPVDSERLVQTSSSIPKDAYELQKFIDAKAAEFSSEKFSIEANHEWKKSQEKFYKNRAAGGISEDARVQDEKLDQDDEGKLFGGQVAQSFVIAWISLLLVTLVWRVK